MDNDLGEELSRRRKAGWIAFAKLSDILTNTKTLPSVKTRLFISIILLVLLYGCETWNTMLAGERKLGLTGRLMERRMVGIDRLQHMPDENLRSRSGVWDIVGLMCARKHSWAYHVARMNDDR
ncbi:unnamed protein product [Toxocara canis]|uniref:DDE_Tnp_1_7 domain-containing protein n=1 Tax=Toxocara canis TaxID=6265 RepID=A0A183UUF5_TOXCA|nr:unnamed protein product [Toxocara canis]